METKGFFHIEIIINLNTYMLWVYSLYKYFNSFSESTAFRRQILTSKDGLRAERVKNSMCTYRTLSITKFAHIAG